MLFPKIQISCISPPLEAPEVRYEARCERGMVKGFLADPIVNDKLIIFFSNVPRFHLKQPFLAFRQSREVLLLVESDSLHSIHMIKLVLAYWIEGLLCRPSIQSFNLILSCSFSLPFARKNSEEKHFTTLAQQHILILSLKRYKCVSSQSLQEHFPEER